jgi:hypothetical protein
MDKEPPMKADAPATPDYAAAAKAQGQANIDAQKVNNPNVVTPYGTQTVSYGTDPVFDAKAYFAANPDVAANEKYKSNAEGHYNDYGKTEGRQPFYTSPATNGGANQATLTQTLNPTEQATYDQGATNRLGLGKLGAQGITAAQGIIGTPVDYSGAPTTGSYDDTRKKVIEAMMGRADEDYAKRTDQSNSDLVAAGIRPGSKAYADAQQMIERSRNDAYQQAEIAGGNAASQAYGMDSDRRRQSITEMLAERSIPLNEINSLVSGSQVSNPFSAPGYQQNMAPAPTYQGFSDTAAYNTDVFNMKNMQQQNLQNGLFSLAGSGAMAYGMKR